MRDQICPHDSIEGRFKPEIIQRIVIPHKSQCGREFLHPNARTERSRERKSETGSLAAASPGYSLIPPRASSALLELSRILIEAFFIGSIKPCSRCSRHNGWISSGRWYGNFRKDGDPLRSSKAHPGWTVSPQKPAATGTKPIFSDRFLFHSIFPFFRLMRVISSHKAKIQKRLRPPPAEISGSSFPDRSGKKALFCIFSCFIVVCFLFSHAVLLLRFCFAFRSLFPSPPQFPADIHAIDKLLEVTAACGKIRDQNLHAGCQRHTVIRSVPPECGSFPVLAMPARSARD